MPSSATKRPTLPTAPLAWLRAFRVTTWVGSPLLAMGILVFASSIWWTAPLALVGGLVLDHFLSRGQRRGVAQLDAALNTYVAIVIADGRSVPRDTHLQALLKDYRCLHEAIRVTSDVVQGARDSIAEALFETVVKAGEEPIKADIEALTLLSQSAHAQQAMAKIYLTLHQLKDDVAALGVEKQAINRAQAPTWHSLVEFITYPYRAWAHGQRAATWLRQSAAIEQALKAIDTGGDGLAQRLQRQVLTQFNVAKSHFQPGQGDPTAVPLVAQQQGTAASDRASDLLGDAPALRTPPPPPAGGTGGDGMAPPPETSPYASFTSQPVSLRCLVPSAPPATDERGEASPASQPQYPAYSQPLSGQPVPHAGQPPQYPNLRCLDMADSILSGLPKPASTSFPPPSG